MTLRPIRKKEKHPAYTKRCAGCFLAFRRHLHRAGGAEIVIEDVRRGGRQRPAGRPLLHDNTHGDLGVLIGGEHHQKAVGLLAVPVLAPAFTGRSLKYLAMAAFWVTWYMPSFMALRAEALMSMEPSSSGSYS